MEKEMTSAGKLESFQIQPATKTDVPIILAFVKKLADYERLSHEVSATEQSLSETLFGRRRTAEVAIGYFKRQPVCFTLFFHNSSPRLRQRVISLCSAAGGGTALWPIGVVGARLE